MSQPPVCLKPITALSLLAAAILFGAVPSASAFSTYKTTFNSRYGTATTRLDSCATCHTSASSPGPLNPYGEAVFNRLNIGDTIGTALANIEPLDSDGDTFSNLTEINARTFPGNASDFPVATAPNIAVAPTSLSFGAVEVGANSTLSVTITNTGNATLTISSRSLTGSTDFSFATAPSAPFNIAAGGSSVISVRYTPNAIGTDNGTLAIASNDPDTSMVSVSLAGTGVACNTTISPLALAFGEVTVGDNATLMVTIVNNGTSTCAVNGLIVSGSTAFTLGPSAPVTPFDLTPSSSVMVPVVFAPSAAGLASGTLQVASTDPNTPTTNIALTGSGGPPPAVCQLTFSPLSVSFGNVAVGVTSSASVTVTNKSTASCSVTSYNLAGSSDFAVGPGAPVAPFDVAPGSGIAIPIAYTPSATGPVSGTLTVTGTDVINASVDIPVSGTGVACDLGLTPTALDFGTVLVGNTSSQSVTLTNSGALACTVSAASISGSTDFALGNGAPGLPASIPPGVSTNIPVAYTPSDAGADSGLLTITSNDPHQPNQSASLTGSGQIPSPECDLHVTPASLEFGDVVVGTNAQAAVTIENIGSASCTVTGWTLTGSADFQANLATPLNLAPNASTTVAVDFQPTSVGTNAAMLQIASTDASDPTISVPLFGIGIQSALAVSPSAIDFGTVTISNTASRVLSIFNEGSSSATVQSISIAGSPAYSLGTPAPSLPLAVAPNAFVDIPINFNPTEIDIQTATLTIASDDPSNPIFEVALTGTGNLRTRKVDLDIVRFRVTGRYELESDDSAIRIRLVIKNNGRGEELRPATVVGHQDGVVVYKETITVSAPRGESRRYGFPSYTPRTRGRITWIARIKDDNADTDRATAETRVYGDDSDEREDD